MIGDVVISDLRRDDGVLSACVSLGEDRVPVTFRCGVWGTLPDDRGHWRAVLPFVASALQQRARKL